MLTRQDIKELALFAIKAIAVGTLCSVVVFEIIAMSVLP